MNNLVSFSDHLNPALDKEKFNEAALKAYEFHKKFNPVYKQYIEISGRINLPVNCIKDIPFLPVTFFKENKILPEGHTAATIFRSSTTTSSKPSQHFVSDISVYEKSLYQSFRFAFGDPEDFIFIALLPSYLERNDSSLVYMMNTLMETSNRPLNGFYLNEFDKLAHVLDTINKSKSRCLFIGVSFALCEFAEKHPIELGQNITIMETGGMKGRSKDISRKDLHDFLKKAFSKNEIAGEYGMTELLSQSYSSANGLYQAPPWVRVFARDIHDPFTILDEGEFGALNIIDLANYNSCPFLATDDTGTIFSGNSFEVLGRVTNSDIRGCNLMV